MSHYPRSGPLSGEARVRWMQRLIGGWALVGLAIGDRLIVATKAGGYVAGPEGP